MENDSSIIFSSSFVNQLQNVELCGDGDFNSAKIMLAIFKQQLLASVVIWKLSSATMSKRAS